MRTVKFKDETTVLQVAGIGRVDKTNITPEKYDRIIALSDNHAKFFTVTEETPKTDNDDTEA